jgi:hypothetical protein
MSLFLFVYIGEHAMRKAKNSPETLNLISGRNWRTL